VPAAFFLSYKRMKKLVIFDLDGTLLDTIEDLGNAVNYILERHGMPQYTVEQYRKMVGHGIRNLIRKAFSPMDLDDAFLETCVAEFKEFYLAHIDEHTRPFPGIVALLDDLYAHGVKLAVVSNKVQEGTERLIHEFFPDIVFVAIFGNRVGYPMKPAPEIVASVLAKAGCAPSDAVMVGDSNTDMQTAANGSIDGIAVSWGNRTREQLAGNRIADTVEELQKCLLDESNLLETKRLRFRPWFDKDAEVLFKYASDPEVGPRAGWPPHQSVQDSLQVIRSIFSNGHTWALELKETGEPVGCMGYYAYGESNIDIAPDDAELGYWIAKPYWNHGLCSEALQVMIDYCFNIKHFQTLWADFFVDNPASGRVMEKCGFQDTGRINWCSRLYQGNEKPVKIMRLNRQ
jgi:HAD superfamily hydrolase (TIGR01549 family)